MRARSLFALSVTALWILACSGGEEAEEGGGDEGGGEEGAPVELEPGHIHLAYPTSSLDAEPGQYVLAPSRSALDRAASEGSGTFIYYLGKLVETGDVESKVESLAGTESTLPNTLIIPIDQGYSAAPGDVLLGHWESGSGMRRAFVTGGSPSAPTVRYLDDAYDKDGEAKEKEDTFEANRYEPLVSTWQLGTTVACGEGTDRKHGVLVHDGGDQILVSGWASKLEVKERSECVSLPPRQRFADGDTVYVPVIGAYSEGTVTRFDRDTGRVWVKYTWGGKDKEEAFPMLDVTKTFEGLDEGAEDDRPREGGGDRAGRGGNGQGGGKGGQRGDRKVRPPR